MVMRLGTGRLGIFALYSMRRNRSARFERSSRFPRHACAYTLIQPLR
ncbi:hypothetical protein GOB43_12165 [Sinorhizobium meliloti]|nr:hypothetical protein [Sinorhizobium meliloti]MDW9441178.1 hypothetical protein [Sinorhizobium meliloti]MDW9453813.1 hypothetical protein [Sinorhizobium meliloti]MDW9466716.1 hypothetical protein [Sinorhizobium meliloti]MDW9518048.1 hypothetical protein [Sinorhizobium meliloti]